MKEKVQSESKRNQVTLHPFIVRVWKIMQKEGLLDGLAGDEKIKKVLAGVDEIMKSQKNK